MMDKNKLRDAVATILTYCHSICESRVNPTPCGGRCILKRLGGTCPIYSDSKQCEKFNLNINDKAKVSEIEVLKAVEYIITQCGPNHIDNCNRLTCPLNHMSYRGCAYDFTKQMRSAILKWTDYKTQRKDKSALLQNILRKR